LLTKIESCSHIWQKIFVLQNLEKAFSLFMFKLYNQTNTKSTYFVLFLFIFFVYKQKNQHFTVGFDNFMIL
ncbi:TPA: hypothetical protein ACIRHZ_001951, partial [Streptococcus suis]